MKRQRNTLAKREKDGVFSLFMEGRTGEKTKRRRNLEMVIIFCQISLPHPWSISLSRLKLLFDSHGATHPTQEWRSSGSAGEMQKQKAPAGLGSAAEALDGVGLD